MERRAEAAGTGRSKTVCPGCNVGEVVAGGIGEDLLGKLLGRRLHEVRGDVGYCIVPKHTPGVGAGEGGKKRCASNGSLHGVLFVMW